MDYKIDTKTKVTKDGFEITFDVKQPKPEVTSKYKSGNRTCLTCGYPYDRNTIRKFCPNCGKAY